MPLTLILPLVFSAIFFIAMLWAIFRRPRYRCIEDAILFSRRLEISDLELLLDPAEEWSLQNALPKNKFYAVQLERVRLANEYVQRVAHNAEVIQGWMLQEYEPIRHKEQDQLNEKERLIADLFQTATDLRIYALGARMKFWSWKVLQFWPGVVAPRLADLRIVCGVNVVQKYQLFTETAESLSHHHGHMYLEKMQAAL